MENKKKKIWYYKMIYIWKLIIIIIFIGINIKNYFNDSNESIYSKRLKLSTEFNKIHSNLYFLAKEGRIESPSYNNNSIINNYTIIKKQGLCLCSLSKNENLYAREFIEYYHSLGFEKIIIFDNNDINGEKIEYVLKDYIKNKFVEIIDVRGISSAQIPSFNYCYKKYNQLFDWIAFFDFDEFLFINNYTNINDYIYNKRFENCQTILFNWFFYDDNDLEKYDGRKIIERFTHPKMKSQRVKSIVRGNIKNLIIPVSFILGINIDFFCNPNGIRIYPKTFDSSPFQNDYTIFIKTFLYKNG